MDTIHPSSFVEPYQLDVYDVLALDAEERYAHDERMGKVLADILCEDCPDPAGCAAERVCQHTLVCDFVPSGAEWDEVPS